MAVPQPVRTAGEPSREQAGRPHRTQQTKGRAAVPPGGRLLRADRSPRPSPPQQREPGSLGFLISPEDCPRRCGRGAPATSRSWGMGLQVGVRAPPSPGSCVVPGGVAVLFCRRACLRGVSGPGHIRSSPQSQEDTALLGPHTRTGRDVLPGALKLRDILVSRIRTWASGPSPARPPLRR